MVDPTQNSNSQNEESEVVNPPSKEEQEAEVLDESDKKKKSAQKGPLKGLVVPPDADKKANQEEVAVSTLKNKSESLEVDELKIKFEKFSKSYYENLDKADLKEIERLRKKAESDSVTMLDLQGGWEWLGIKEKEQDKKYLKMAQIYLKKEDDVLLVKAELDNTYKTKYGIGAGDLLPPSVTEVEITDLRGNVRRGSRMIKRGRVGYYDSSGKYIPIFGGYKMKPIAFRDEKETEYKDVVSVEKKNYVDNKEAAEAYVESVTTTPPEVLAYAGNTDYPISTIKSLRTADLDKLKKEVGVKGVEKIETAKFDLIKIEALLDHFNIRMNARSEINGGLNLVALSGKSPGMLGWKTEHGLKQERIFSKLTDKNNLQKVLKDLENGNKKKIIEGIQIVKDEKSKDGYYFVDSSGKRVENLAKWTVAHVAKSVLANNTVEFISALQKGSAYELLGEDYEFEGGYDLDLNHLHIFHSLVNTGKLDLKRILDKVGFPASTEDFLKALSERGSAPEGMNIDEAMAYIESNRANLGYLLGDDGQKVTLLDLYEMSKTTKTTKKAIRRVGGSEGKYRFTAFKDEKDYPYQEGRLMCAYTVSTFLGLGSETSSFKGKTGSVRHLAARLMRGNLEKTDGRSAGIVFGFKNYRRGDVLIFKGSSKYAPGSFGHTGIVTFNREIEVYDTNGNYVGKERYIGIQDDGSDLQATIIPVNARSHTWRALSKAMKNPKSRAKYLAKYPEIAEMWEFRKGHSNNFRVRGNAGWWGDADQSRSGRIAFAVRTQGLLTPQALV